MTSITPAQIKALAEQHGTPFWIYDAQCIRDQINKLRNFDVIRYAQKACSNTHILRLMKEEGVVIDAVSGGEISRSLAAGFSNEISSDHIVFTADLIDDATLEMLIKQRIPVNAGSLDMLEKVGRYAKGHKVWLRVNPGFGYGHSRKTNTGGAQSKHGIWHDDLPQAIRMIKAYQLELVGIHMHIGSGIHHHSLSDICRSMVEIAKNLDHDFQSISAGGGLSIPYKQEEEEFDTAHYFECWHQARNEIADFMGHPIRLEIEPGRFLVAQSGLLVSTAHILKSTPNHDFVIVDAGFNDLVRPSFYGSFHEISVLGKETQSSRDIKPLVVAGPLCETGDVFTVDQEALISHRNLPTPEIGDLILFHDAGAYGASMSSNYNSRPLAPEVLIDQGNAKLIRRRQTIEELLLLEEC